MGAKIYALQNARELCFQSAIGENDARTLAYEVAPAAKPPQVTPIIWARASIRGEETASIAVAAPRGDAHI